MKTEDKMWNPITTSGTKEQDRFDEGLEKTEDQYKKPFRKTEYRLASQNNSTANTWE